MPYAMLNAMRGTVRTIRDSAAPLGHTVERNVGGKRFLVNALRRRHSATRAAAQVRVTGAVGALPWWPRPCHDARRTPPFRRGISDGNPGAPRSADGTHTAEPRPRSRDRKG